MTARNALLLLLAALVVAAGIALAPGFRASPAADSSPAMAGAASAEDAAQGGKIIAYYFHVTVRCQTCLAIERYSEQAIKESFGKELAAGKIEWRPVNVQLPENRHFIKDYKLFTRSLVYVLVKGGKQSDYKVLDRTWELVGREKWLKDYVRQEMERYLRRLG